MASALRKYAMSFDGATEDYPWGERVVKTNGKKIFVFLGDPYQLDGALCCTIKLPRSGKEVLKKPFAKPCGYGLGKHGWVTIRIESGSKAPAVATFKSWIKESYEAVCGT